MDFTFGICATRDNSSLHRDIISSIHALGVPRYEILMIGGDLDQRTDATVLPFDETQRKGWITRKKNILCQNAKYSNIVLLHDYVTFHPYWYSGFLNHGDNFQVAMSVILNADGIRFRDWCLNPYDVIPPKGPIINREFMLPYDESRLSHKMYISGTYWVAKTKFMLENPLDENLSWGESEDMEWSNRIRKKTELKMYPDSVVHCMKQKYCDFTLISPENITRVLGP